MDSQTLETTTLPSIAGGLKRTPLQFIIMTPIHFRIVVTAPFETRQDNDVDFGGGNDDDDDD